MEVVARVALVASAPLALSVGGEHLAALGQERLGVLTVKAIPSGLAELLRFGVEVAVVAFTGGVVRMCGSQCGNWARIHAARGNSLIPSRFRRSR